MKKGRFKQIFKTVFTVCVVTAYFLCITVLIWQALTPGSQSANISNNVGNQIDGIVSSIHQTEVKKIPVTEVTAVSYTVGESTASPSGENALTCGDEGSVLFDVAPANASNKSLTYSSTDEGVIKVNSDGTFTALTPGNCAIKATSAENSAIYASINFKVNAIDATGVSIDNKISELKVSQKHYPEVTVTPTNATYKDVEWATTDGDVLSVSDDGVITAIAEGVATVTVKLTRYPEITDSFTVEVLPLVDDTVFAESVEITFDSADDEARAYFFAKETVQLHATVSPDNVTNGGVSWKSSSTGVATVSSKGLVTFKKGGTVTITATSSDGCARDTVTFTVRDILPSVITVTSTSLDIKTDGDGYVATLSARSTAKLTVKLSSDSTTKTVKYSSDNTSVAKVSGSGQITAIGVGTANIKIYCTNQIDEVAVYLKLTVTEEIDHIFAEAISVTEYLLGDTAIPVTDGKAEIYDGDEIEIHAVISPTNATEQTYTVKSSDESVLKVTSSGLIAALRPGTATLTFTVSADIRLPSDPTYPSCTLEVTVKKIEVTSVTISNAPKELVEEESITLSASVCPSNATYQSLIWSSDDEDIATVTADGTVTALRPGEVTITATSEDNPSATFSVTINIVPKTIVLESIEASEDEAVLKIGEQLTVTVSFLPDNATHKGLIWHTSDQTVATVNASGVITAKKAGCAIITVSSNTYEGITQRIVITVKERVSTQISFDFKGFTLDGDSLTLKEATSAKVTASLDKDATVRTITYESSDESIATVGQDGTIQGIAPGTARITLTTTDGETLTSAYFDVTITKVTLKDSISNFYYKIRKLIGHFGAFIALGLCAALSYIMLSPRSFRGKLMAFILCYVSGFAVAGITEICQLPEFTAGRGCSFNDVMLDFQGYSYAVFAVFGIALIVFLIRLITKKLKGKNPPSGKSEITAQPDGDNGDKKQLPTDITQKPTEAGVADTNNL